VLAAADNLIIAGARRADAPLSNSGAAHLFIDDEQFGFWPEIEKLVPSDPGEYAEFGRSVAIEGDLAIIGAPEKTIGLSVGAAYVFAGLTGLDGPDCDLSGTPDACDIADGTAQDCNANGAPDSCDLADGASRDCNGNGIPEEGEARDCNANGAPDSCEIVDGDSTDYNGNGVPDDCECLADFSSNDEVDMLDLMFLLNVWCACADCPPACVGDVTEDCQVDILDLLAMLSSWGPCP
jgi:hypothetical protein